MKEFVESNSNRATAANGSPLHHLQDLHSGQALEYFPPPPLMLQLSTPPFIPSFQTLLSEFTKQDL